ncbi:MAG: thioredoxin family protein [Planctomycetota bacterium]
MKLREMVRYGTLACAVALIAALAGTSPAEEKATESGKKLPKVIDLGAGKCIPCKKMAPILESLKEELKGKADVVFIDVWQNPGEGEKYKIDMIPTQIFFDAEGKEVFRHVGFFSREEILAQFKKMGVDVPKE